MATIQKYRSYIFSYGVLTLLYVLEHYEHIENFDECHNIVSAINQLKIEHDLPELPTRRSDEFLKKVIESYKHFNLTGENADNNSRHYAYKIIKENELNE